MSTYQRLNGLSGNLQSSSSWSRQQALEQIQNNVIQAMSSLNPQEKARYVRLQREALSALTALEHAQQALTRDFKTQGLAQLREKIGGRDPEQYTLFTRYKEKREQGFPWDPPQPLLPLNTVPLPAARYRRAHYDFHYIEHLKHMSLWEAACLNYGFTHSIHGDSGFSLVEASYIVGPDNDRSLGALAFIEAARTLDLGAQLRDKARTAMAPGGPLRPLFEASAKASLLFDAIEAYRNRATTGVTLEIYTRLNAAIEGTGAQLPFDTLNLSSGITPLISVPFVPWDSCIPVPLMLIRVASLGVLSYFPFRPGGALQYHDDTQAAEYAFRTQLTDSHAKKDLGWFSRQLPLIGLSVFRSLINKAPHLKGFSWLGAYVYDGFHLAFSTKTLDNIRFNTDIKSGRAITLVQACAYRQIQRFQSDLDTLAQTRSEKDWQALKDAAAAIAGEVLQMLLTPLPGGVTGMNRVMQLAVMGSLTYSAAQGVNELAKGEASGFASALADVTDLAVSGKLISTAGRAHRQRMHAYLEKLGNPYKITRADGSHGLWKADAQPYAHDNQRLVNGITPNALGIYTVEGHLYAKLRQGEMDVLIEVKFDDAHKRYVLTRGKDGYTPAIIFAPELQAWTFDLHNAHLLSNPELLQRMLPNGASTIPSADLEHMLRSTATTRDTLDRVWRAQPAPLNLIEGARRLQVDQLIQQIIERFPQPGQLPAHADSTVFCLLTQLNGWPTDTLLHIHDAQGTRIETYGKTEQPPPRAHAINLKRREDGSYTDLNDAGSGPEGNEHLLQLIIRQQPRDSALGKEDQPNASEDARVSSVREQVGALASLERHALFSALFDYWGYEKAELAAAPAARRFLPVKVSPALITVTPLLKKLRDLNPPLTAANLARLLAEQPLTARQQEAFLSGGTLPVAFVETLDRQRTALRIDAVIDSLYNPRDFNADTDLWAREFAGALIRDTLKRPFVVTDVSQGETFVPSGADDLTVNLRLHPGGRYQAYDIRNDSEIPVSPAQDSFYLAIASVLHPHERQQLGMSSVTDAKGLRKTLGDNMSARRNPQGHVSLVNGSLVPYQHNLMLSPGLKPRTDGIFMIEGNEYLPLFGSLFRIVFDKTLFKWRLKHPKKIGVDTPLLEHNGQGTWRLASENPMTWDTHQLFHRLGHEDYAFTQERASQILALTDTPDHVLRQVHRATHPVPPLLADTCKRFKIEQQIQHFINALRVNPNTQEAEPALQLLVISALPGWPDNHRLQIVGPGNEVRYQYPASAGPNAETILVTEQDYRDARLLNQLTGYDTLINALLGELPSSAEERLFKLVKKIVEFAEKETNHLFNSLYQESEHRSPNVARERFKAAHADLPNNTVDSILGHATPRELKQLHEHGKVSLRLGETARLTAHEVRLNRAFEGLYLDNLINPDSDRIILHLLNTVPGWPSDLRIEVRDRHFSGSSIEAAGNPAGTRQKVLVKQHQVYRAYDSQGAPLATPVGSGSNLLSAIIQTLTDTERSTLGITHEDDLAPLQEQIAKLALSQRVAIKSLLDLPHLQPWLQPPMGLDRSFLVYPVWNWLWPFGGNRAPDLVNRVQELYPRFDNDTARAFIRWLNLDEPAALIELDRRQAEYSFLDIELTRWSDTPRDTDNDETDPLGLHLGRRRHIANTLRRAWRRDEPPQVYIDGLFHAESLTLQLDTIDLPTAAFINGFRGFEHIEHLSIAGDSFPASGHAFLALFPGLRALQIDCQLSELPSAITQMTQLTRLNLEGNALVLTEESAARLAAMVNLENLNLGYNPLGITLDVTRMSQLSTLDLRATHTQQWPIGAADHANLNTLYLQENQISSIPERVFTHPRAIIRNRSTFLHDNPLSPQTLQRVRQYHVDIGMAVGGSLPGIAHTPPAERGILPWLVHLKPFKHDSARELWNGLSSHEGARPDDVFRVLADLTKSLEYTIAGNARKKLTFRVWNLLDGLSNSTELREKVFLNTHAAGTCGDGAILLFNNMELMHRVHQTLARYDENRIDRELLGLAKQVYYLEQLDQFADDHISRLTAQGRSPDPAEITLFYRVMLREEFNLPVQADQMLYSVEGYGVVDNDVQQARQMLRGLKDSPGLVNAYKTCDFWLDYLERRFPAPFLTIKEVTRYKIGLLQKELPDKHSDEHLDRLQALIDTQTAERNRLIGQLTDAALHALPRD
ncbi:MAG: NEL-type E3 ubiquitin ligase domain-containing protein [Pseudomonas veronii]|uniref:NEL-type E3 ubiquitin ligase domain-containing protein n=1 Tax=Pseudomonas veronii TaxID=76761 RepID=UPI003C71C8A9